MQRPSDDDEVLQMVVSDETETCPYLEDRLARIPLRWPLEPLSPTQLDARLNAGDRRYGGFLYDTQCPQCSACEPIRLDVEQFVATRRQRRIQRKGDRLLRVELGEPQIDRRRIKLFNAHRRERNLQRGDRAIDHDGYDSFLARTCCRTQEMSYWLEDELVAVAIIDVGQEAASAVYTYFDPRYARLSLGVYSVLTQVAFCRRQDIRWLYLGYYIAQSPHMSYKAEYQPHQRRIAGQWQASPALAE